MAENIDLYGVLGVERTATTQEIRLAYRAKAKELHPDAPGGDEEKFNQLRMARDVLTNPNWRANYDAIGAIPEDEADNASAAVITALTAMFGTVMGTVIKQGGSPAQGDFIAAMHATIKTNFEGTNRQMTQLQSSRGELAKMTGRFKVLSLEQPNHMETIVSGQLGLIDRQLDQCQKSLAQLEAARLYLNDIHFEQEPG